MFPIREHSLAKQVTELYGVGNWATTVITSPSYPSGSVGHFPQPRYSRLSKARIVIKRIGNGIAASHHPLEIPTYESLVPLSSKPSAHFRIVERHLSRNWIICRSAPTSTTHVAHKDSVLSDNKIWFSENTLLLALRCYCVLPIKHHQVKIAESWFTIAPYCQVICIKRYLIRIAWHVTN